MTYFKMCLVYFMVRCHFLKKLLFILSSSLVTLCLLRVMNSKLKTNDIVTIAPTCTVFAAVAALV